MSGLVLSFDGSVPLFGERVWVAETGTVIGDVHLGDDANVWYGAVLRGDVFPIRIGARTNIQDGCIVHVTGGFAATTVGDDVTVGHLALLHGCTVGNRVLVGMGSTILDNAVIEDDCMIAAGALVTPGTRIPSGSVVMGRPGKVVRALSDEDRARIAFSSAHYVELAAAFAAGKAKPVDPRRA